MKYEVEHLDTYPPNPREGLDPRPWLRAQAAQAGSLADAALAVGRLEAMLTGMDKRAHAGAIHRLALIETEAMLWADGMPLRREEIGRDYLDARADTDLEAMRLARWAIRRLEGQGALEDLRGFLSLHRIEGMAGMGGDLAPRPAGVAFDETAAAFLGTVRPFDRLHPLARGPVMVQLWRLAGLSFPGRITEAAVWSGRHMAVSTTLPFLPLGQHGRSVWVRGGDIGSCLGAHLEAVHRGADQAWRLLMRIVEWAEAAQRMTCQIKGDTAVKVIAVLAAHPLVSAPMVETEAGISRITAERMLNRMTGMGLIREITGAGRFRLWMVAE